MSRGAKHWIDGADEAAKEIQLQPLMSGARAEDEGLFVLQHRHWLASMKKAVEQEQQNLIHVEAGQ
ncbi:2-halobenzoate 1,2-dioxygenase large subunit [compost metagenome]